MPRAILSERERPDLEGDGGAGTAAAVVLVVVSEGLVAGLAEPVDEEVRVARREVKLGEDLDTDGDDVKVPMKALGLKRDTVVFTMG